MHKFHCILIWFWSLPYDPFDYCDNFFTTTVIAVNHSFFHWFTDCDYNLITYTHAKEHTAPRQIMIIYLSDLIWIIDSRHPK